MSTISYNNDQFEKVFEISNILEDFKSHKRTIKNAVGEVGLRIAMPFYLISNIIRVANKKSQIKKFVKKGMIEFQESDERFQMEFELKFLNASHEFEEQLTPVIKILEANKSFLNTIFVRQVKSILDLIQQTAKRFTAIVYPEQIDPATEPTLFNELVKAYKGVDLSDWKKEILDESKRSLVKHG